MIKSGNANSNHKRTKEKNTMHYDKAKEHSSMNKLFLLVIVLFCAGTVLIVKYNSLHNQEIQEGIAKEIIRFHVIANSDSEADQKLKLKVKDELVKQLTPLLSKASSIADARAVITDNEARIQQIAKDTIKQNGYDYAVDVSLGEAYFPLKLYGEYSFPPGNYEALRVRIGDASGQNWWCVMFPPLCFVDETYNVVDKKTNQKLKHVLTKEEYQSLIATKKSVKIKFKLFENMKKLLK